MTAEEQASSEPNDVVGEIHGVLADAHRAGRRGLVAMRCRGPREVDHARESLSQLAGPLVWRSLPAAQIDPPDLLDYVQRSPHRDRAAFIVHALPKGRDGHVLQRFLELLQDASEEELAGPWWMALVLTRSEVRDLSRSAPNFWHLRDRFVAWPVQDAESRFVPARRRDQLARGGGAVSASSGAPTSGSGQIVFGHPLMDDYEVGGAEQSGQPWVGAPFGEGDEVPRYIREAAPPAGRRWGANLAPDDEEGAELLDTCRAMLDRRESDHARQGLAKAVRRFRTNGNEAATAEAFVLMGRACELRFDNRMAEEWYGEAIELYDGLSDHAGASDACSMIGYLRFMHGDLDGALGYFDRALRRDEKAGDQLRTAAGYRRTGIIFEQRGELKRAGRLYEQAAEIERDNEDRYALSRSLHHQARVAQRRDAFDEADDLLRKSLEIKEDQGDSKGLATGYHELGNLQLRREEYEEAKASYEKALDLEERSGDVGGIAVTQAQLGLVSRHRLELGEAYRRLYVARQLFQRLESPNRQQVDQALRNVQEIAGGAADLDAERAAAQDYVEQLLGA